MRLTGQTVAIVNDWLRMTSERRALFREQAKAHGLSGRLLCSILDDVETAERAHAETAVAAVEVTAEGKAT